MLSSDHDGTLPYPVRELKKVSEHHRIAMLCVTVPTFLKVKFVSLEIIK
jgi:hypothetical protein